ncbi:MAG: MBL fold metallo-hydrolase [Coriobacteriales bacterium]|jgi:hydroxyacylglutathione hydrolase
MEIKLSQVGPLATNCYMVFDDTACIIVDPGYDADTILKMLDGRKPDAIVITHGHMDHIGALPDLVDATGAPIVAYSGEVNRILDPEMNPDPAYFGYLPVKKVDVQLEDGQDFTVGDLTFKVLHTPGHTAGSMCLYSSDYGVLLSGDTLFFGAHGRTDFPGGDQEAMNKSMERLSKLPPETQVFPGHDRPTTIGAESAWMARL